MEPLKLIGHGLVTNSIVYVLKRYGKTHEIRTVDKPLLSEAENLLEQIINGATLIERDNYPKGFLSTAEGLDFYGRALNIVENLGLPNHSLKDLQKRGVLPFFTDMNKKLAKLKDKDKNKYNPKDLSLLLKFFTELRDSFLSDSDNYFYGKPDIYYEHLGFA